MENTLESLIEKGAKVVGHIGLQHRRILKLGNAYYEQRIEWGKDESDYCQPIAYNRLNELKELGLINE